MDIFDDIGASKSSAKVFLKVNYTFKYTQNTNTPSSVTNKKYTSK